MITIIPQCRARHGVLQLRIDKPALQQTLRWRRSHLVQPPYRLSIGARRVVWGAKGQPTCKAPRGLLPRFKPSILGIRYCAVGLPSLAAPSCLVPVPCLAFCSSTVVVYLFGVRRSTPRSCSSTPCCKISRAPVHLLHAADYIPCFTFRSFYCRLASISCFFRVSTRLFRATFCRFYQPSLPLNGYRSIEQRYDDQSSLQCEVAGWYPASMTGKLSGCRHPTAVLWRSYTTNCLYLNRGARALQIGPPSRRICCPWSFLWKCASKGCVR